MPLSCTMSPAWARKVVRMSYGRLVDCSDCHCCHAQVRFSLFISTDISVARDRETPQSLPCVRCLPGRQRVKQQQFQNKGGWRFALTLLALFVWIGMSPRQAIAQDYRAKITVEVKDASDALVSGASIKLTRVSTKTTTPATTDASGAFVFQLLEPDTYP